MKHIRVLMIALVAGCGAEDHSYTLYRDSVTDPNMRLHIATFDASEKEEYNRENCDVAQKLFQSQPNIKTRFWCEKGRHRR